MTFTHTSDSLKRSVALSCVNRAADCTGLMLLTHYWSSGSICIPGMGRWLCWTSAPLLQGSHLGRCAASSPVGCREAPTPSWPPRPPELQKIWPKANHKVKQTNIFINQPQPKILSLTNTQKTNLPGSLSIRSECSLPSFSAPCSGRLMMRRGLW